MEFLQNISYLDVVGIVIALVVTFIFYLKWKLTFWQKLGIPTLNPSLPFGDTKNLMLGKRTFGEQFADIYKEFKARGVKYHGGVYLGAKPYYTPLDPALIKCIMQKDFQHFVNHGFFIDEEKDPLSAHLFNMEDTKWKNMRTKLTPTFTSGKMKMMFQTFADCSIGLNTIMDESASNRAPLDVKDVLSRFTTDIIASVAFGLECNTLKDPDAPFRKFGRRVFEINAWERLKFIMQFTFSRNFLKAVGFKITKSDVEKFFMKVVRDTVAYREKHNISRKDIMHLLIQLKNRGIVADDDKITGQENGLTMNELAAQAYVFFIGGFETSSTTSTFALYELATNQHVQEKLRSEINTVLKKYNNELTYDAMMEMTYMENVIHETLRKYPPVPILMRECNKEYLIPNTSITLPKGISVFIPILGLHEDPEYYPNPETFDPERFSEEQKNSRPAFTWLPFGEGPRVCIGLRFGMLQTKVGLTALLKNYRVKLNPKTKLPLQLDKNDFVTTAEGGIWLNVEKL